MQSMEVQSIPSKRVSMIKLLIVDDSALMRKLLVQLFEQEGDFEVCTARNGAEALQVQRSFQPDVITLDINMPEMDGLTALSMLMAERPTAVVMVSSLTEKGAMATFEALALGAVDFIPKPGGTISLSIDDIQPLLVAKVRAAAKSRGRLKGATKGSIKASASTLTTHRQEATVSSTKSPLSLQPVHRGTATAASPRQRVHGVVAIGVSTGGPRALENILPKLPQDFPWPVLVAQHMPPLFTEAFAKRLNALCALNVQEVGEPMLIKPGNVYIGRGGTDMVVTERLGQLMVVPKPEDTALLWHPSVEALMQSLHSTFAANQCIGVMLTGMGYDGAQSMSALKAAGARTIAESEETSTVFGMPAELIKRDGASVVLPIHKIANQIIYWANQRGH